MSPTALRHQPRLSAFWTLRREASLNWLALGLLLAAWNASDNDAAAGMRRRPEALRGYSYVSVRAANRMASNHMTEINRWRPSKNRHSTAILEGSNVGAHACC
jgi:hypothetical protein